MLYNRNIGLISTSTEKNIYDFKRQLSKTKPNKMATAGTIKNKV